MAHSPFTFLSNGTTGISPSVDLDGQYHNIGLTYKTEPDLTNNNGSSIVVETSDSSSGPWAQFTGFSPGASDADANVFFVGPVYTNFYNLIRARVVSSFTGGGVTVKLYFD